jgi:hypothetical protein
MTRFLGHERKRFRSTCSRERKRFRSTCSREEEVQEHLL